MDTQDIFYKNNLNKNIIVKVNEDAFKNYVPMKLLSFDKYTILVEVLQKQLLINKSFIISVEPEEAVDLSQFNRPTFEKRAKPNIQFKKKRTFDKN